MQKTSRPLDQARSSAIASLAHTKSPRKYPHMPIAWNSLPNQKYMTYSTSANWNPSKKTPSQIANNLRLNPRSLKAKRNLKLRKSLTPRSTNDTRNLYVTLSNGLDTDQTQTLGRHLHGSPMRKNVSWNTTKNIPSNQVHNHQLLQLPQYTKTTQEFDTPS
jgi:hypothetical protein